MSKKFRRDAEHRRAEKLAARPANPQSVIGNHRIEERYLRGRAHNRRDALGRAARGGAPGVF